MKNLKKLYLNNNCIKEISGAIMKLDKLIELNVSNNELQWIPDSISHLKELHELDISHNQLKELTPHLGIHSFSITNRLHVNSSIF